MKKEDAIKQRLARGYISEGNVLTYDLEKDIELLLRAAKVLRKLSNLTPDHSPAVEEAVVTAEVAEVLAALDAEEAQ